MSDTVARQSCRRPSNLTLWATVMGRAGGAPAERAKDMSAWGRLELQLRKLRWREPPDLDELR